MPAAKPKSTKTTKKKVAKKPARKQAVSKTPKTNLLERVSTATGVLAVVALLALMTVGVLQGSERIEAPGVASEVTQATVVRSSGTTAARDSVSVVENNDLTEFELQVIDTNYRVDMSASNEVDHDPWYEGSVEVDERDVVVDYTTPADLNFRSGGEFQCRPFYDDEQVWYKQCRDSHFGTPKIHNQQVHWTDTGTDYTGWVIRFDETAEYDVTENYPCSHPLSKKCDEDSDQKDWSKLVGQTWAPRYGINPSHRNTAMIGWRWNKDEAPAGGEKGLELTFYYHDDNKNKYHGNFPGGLFPEIPVVSAETNKDYHVVYELSRENSTFSAFIAEKVTDDCFEIVGEHHLENFKNEPQFNGAELDFDDDGRSRQVNAYFGGQCKAPQDIYFDRRILDSVEASTLFSKFAESCDPPEPAGPLEGLYLVYTEASETCSAIAVEVEAVTTGGDNLTYNWEYRRLFPSPTGWNQFGYSGGPSQLGFLQRDFVLDSSYEIRVTVTDSDNNITLSDSLTATVGPRPEEVNGVPCPV